jgi:uncharacterized 2Fe-2S/4Fe-4S cluster protein (DUF4445 family)
MDQVKVTFLPDEVEVEVEPGTSVLGAAGQAGILIQAPCGGVATCGRCVVRVEEGAWEPNDAEKRLLPADELREGFRLACQARLSQDVVVFIPETSRIAKYQILVQGVASQVEVEPVVRKVFLRLPRPSLQDLRSDLARVIAGLGGPPIKFASDPKMLADAARRIRASDFQVTAVLSGSEIIEIESGDTSSACYGVAADIGTTTLVVYLVRLDTGEQVGLAAGPNPQARHGDDVISRIQFAHTDPDGLGTLQALVRDALNRLIEQARRGAGVERNDIWEFVAVGNSCMAHLFLGVSPDGLGMAPYLPAFSSAQRAQAAWLGLSINPRGRVYYLPGIAGFVGADTVGVILSTEIYKDGRLRAAVDIGTNGEVVVARQGALVAASGAAGPAFEGGRISSGMPAAPGAIDSVRINGGVKFTTIADAPARGICGSGLVDALAELRRIGVVTPNGRLLDRAAVLGLDESLAARLLSEDGEASFELVGKADGAEEPVRLTAQDVRQLQLAKAAIAAALSVLLARFDAGPADVEELLLAGAFGNYIRPESGLAIGLFPSIPRERIRPVGNAAGAGAKMALLSAPLREKAEALAGSVEYVELADQPEFYERFADNMTLAPAAEGAGR